MSVSMSKFDFCDGINEASVAFHHTIDISMYIIISHRNRPNKFHQQAAHRAGERVPLQQVLDARSSDRDRHGTGPQSNTSQGIVSEQTHEAEETGSRRK